MAVPIDPTSAAFLFAENRQMPMHVGGLQLFEKPEGAPRDYARQIYEQMSEVDEIAPLFLKRPTRGITTAGQWVWTQDDDFDLEYHFRHSALPKPGRVRELLELCSRLHSTRLARERPLWEAHLIEGLRDGRVALYTKMHHSLVDGISAMRLLQSVMTHRPRQARHAARCGRPGPARRPRRPATEAEHSLAAVPLDAMRTALGITADAAGLPGRPGQDAEARPARTRPRRSRSTPRARCSTPPSPGHAASPPRAGRSSGCARSARPAAPPSTTWCWRCAPARSAPT